MYVESYEEARERQAIGEDIQYDEMKEQQAEEWDDDGEYDRQRDDNLVNE